MNFLVRSSTLAITTLCGFLALASPTTYAEYPITGEDILKRAEDLVEVANTANKDDLQLLWDLVTSQYQEKVDLSQKNFTDLRQEVLDKLVSDLEIASNLKNNLSPTASYPLNTSLAKLIGSPSEEGILEHAGRLLREASSIADLNPASLQPTGHKITVLKTLLIYLNCALNPSCWQTVGNQLTLVYPTEPVEEASLDRQSIKPLLQAFTLISSCDCPFQNCLRVPNAGYIFGGGFLNGLLRGVDCSAFVSHCAKIKHRLSTFHFEEIWKFLKHNTQTIDPISRESAVEFVAIETTDPLLPGDLITWRAQGSGHVVFFKHWVTGENRFLGIEASRDINNNIDGIQERIFDLFQNEKATYILRRVQQLDLPPDQPIAE